MLTFVVSMLMKNKNNIISGHFLNFNSKINHYILSLVIIGGTTLICTPLSNTESYHVVSFILLFVVSILATFMGIGPVFLASTLSALVWNYFFIPPHFTFHIDKAEDILMFGMFFIIALVNGVLTTKVRKQERLAREREERTNALFQLTRELSKASGIDQVLTVAISEIERHFSVSSIFILQDGNNILHSTGRLQKEKELTQAEYEVAKWVFKNSKVAGALTDVFPSVEYTLYPLHGTRLVPGVLLVKPGSLFSASQKAFWDTFLTQISNALEREFLGELAQKARFLDESDRLYKTLFNSISHELRIPVATIMGASDTLLNSPHPGNIQLALSQEIFTASLRLNRLIENLLNMSRLESGLISVRLDWVDVNDLVNKVAEDLKDELSNLVLEVIMPDNMPLVKIDFGLMEQVLYNLLFNSSQYAPDSSSIEIKIGHKDGELIILIADWGPGFPEEAIEKVFMKFFRVDNSRPGGLGLGLSIVKGFVEAHKGIITVCNRKHGGAKFTIRIPSENPEIENLQMDNNE